MKLSIEQTLLDSRVGINTPVAQEWPMRPIFVYAIPVDFAANDLFSIHRSLGDDFAVGTADEALSPEFNAIAAGWRFVTDSVCCGDVATVRNRVTALNCFPRRMLRCAKFFFFARMPSDRRRVKNNLRAAQGRQARRFRIPLVPANADADF